MFIAVFPLYSRSIDSVFLSAKVASHPTVIFILLLSLSLSLFLAGKSEKQDLSTQCESM